MRPLWAVGFAGLMIGCTLPPDLTASNPPSPTVRLAPVAAVVDCGVSDLRPPATYDAVGVQCVWNAYSAGTPTRWVVTSYTQEGAPIRGTISFEGGVVLMTRDLSADSFSNQLDRRIWTWRCGAMAQRPFVTDPRRFSLELGKCTGDGAAAVFP